MPTEKKCHSFCQQIFLHMQETEKKANTNNLDDATAEKLAKKGKIS